MPISASAEFKSYRPRRPLPLLQENPNDVEVNNRFPIEFHLSNLAESGQKERDLVIMVNGFADRTDLLYTDSPVGFPHFLRNRGIASVLMPIPFHFGRLPRTTFYRRVATHLARSEEISVDEAWNGIPAFIVRTRPERFYLGYRQLISDLRYLGSAIQHCKDKTHPAYDPMYEEWFDESTRIHLLGYSIGGLGCLAALVKSRMQEEFLDERARKRHRKAPPVDYEEPQFSRCILLCSGATFLDLDPSSLGFSLQDWDKIREYYYQRRFEEDLQDCEERLAEGGEKLEPGDRTRLETDLEALEQISTRGSLSYRLFERVILGVPWAKKDLENATSDVLAILGAKDVVVPPDSLLSIRPSERRFCTILVPGLTHDFLHGEEKSAWSMWSNYVVSSIAGFIEENRPMPRTDLDLCL